MRGASIIAFAALATAPAQAADVRGDRAIDATMQVSVEGRGGLFEFQGDKDWYKVALAAGQDYAVEGSPGGFGVDGFALTVRRPDGLGGVRRTGLLDEIICLQTALLGCFAAAVAFVRGFPIGEGEPRKPGWIAAGAAGLITGVLFLKPLITGEIWLPWL